MVNDLYFKTTYNVRPHFLGPVGGLRIEGPLYIFAGVQPATDFLDESGLDMTGQGFVNVNTVCTTHSVTYPHYAYVMGEQDIFVHEAVHGPPSLGGGVIII